MAELLTRDEFREGVFARDNHRCVFCVLPAADAHHIMERRLWPDGGYYLDNGASVCEPHHLECERTVFTTEHVRERAGITNVLLPPHLYDDTRYDKWGNPYLINAEWSTTRMRGELWYDESVQKIIEGDFVKHVKHPRTYHLPWSLNATKDDRYMDGMEALVGRELVMTAKMDGENTTMYNDHIHARSVDSPNHESRNWVKNLWSQIAHEIPDDMRICGENLYAEHSIHYSDLPSYFMVHSVWQGDRCLSWDQTVEWAGLLDLEVVPLMSRFVLDAGEHLWPTDLPEGQEGYVIRLADEFKMRDYRKYVGKYVRKDHVRTQAHWTRTWSQNELA